MLLEIKENNIIQVTEGWFENPKKPVHKLRVRKYDMEFVYITEGKYQYVGDLSWDKVIALLHEYRRNLRSRTDYDTIT